MADEITLTVQLRVSKGNFDPGTVRFSNLQFDQTAIGKAGGVQEISTSEENLNSGDLTNVGWLLMKNLDDTNYVQWGQDNSSTMQTVGRMEAGEVALLRVEPGIGVRLKANTAAVDIEFHWFED